MTKDHKKNSENSHGDENAHGKKFVATERIGDTEETDLAGGDEPAHSPGDVFDGHGRINPVLIE